MPSWSHTAMPDLPAHKDHISWNVKTILRYAFIESCNFSCQLRTDSFVGVQVQLPLVAQGQIVNCPVALSAIVGKNMLGDLHFVLPSDLQRTVLTKGIDDVDVFGQPFYAGQCQRQGVFRVISKDY